jgi:hypothetical protein
MIEWWHAPLAILLAFVVGGLPVWSMAWWCARRDRRWRQPRDADARRWERQRQRWAMEAQTREGRLPEAARERWRSAREEAAEVTREARRRLGLPEEE